MNKLQSFDFYPKQTNAFDLYSACGEEWGKINPLELTTKDWNVSWESCPKEMLTYIKSLEGFDPAIFEEITGIKVEDSKTIEIEGKKFTIGELQNLIHSAE